MGQGGDTKSWGGGSSPRYRVAVLTKALDVLDILRSAREELRLTEIARAARLDVSTTFRLLHTLQERGYVLHDTKTKKFKICLGYRSYRIGYAQLSSDQPFSQQVTQGLIQAAEKSRIELFVTDNRMSPEEAVKNAAWLISQKVDFVIEYQFHYRVGPVLANMFSKAQIPTLAVDIPQPGATYFGVNNYSAGWMGGEALAGSAKKDWRGRADRVVLLEISEAGPVPHSRVIGTLAGIRHVLPKLNDKCVLHKNAKGTEIGGYVAIRRLLRSLDRTEHLLVAAANDSCARGAIRAVREAGRERFTRIVAQGWGPDAGLDDELEKADSPLIGAVAYHPATYGAAILPVVLKSLNGQPVPPAVYTEHAYLHN